jgi:hypothetical protein
MTHPSQGEMDEGEIMVLLERLHIALPNLLDLKQRVLAGDTLSELEIVELDMMLDHASDARGLLRRHPEYQKIAVRVISLYNEIIDAAVVSEKKGGHGPEIDLSD